MLKVSRWTGLIIQILNCCYNNLLFQINPSSAQFFTLTGPLSSASDGKSSNITSARPISDFNDLSHADQQVRIPLL